MKSCLLGVRTPYTVNIGDYIQALASAQFLPTVDGFVEREELKSYDGEACRMVMNGWYMYNPDMWPPSEAITPLFVAFHINSTVKTLMTSPQSIAYLKRHEPIGCRDRQTQKLLADKGVDAYFSGCMTLTLGRSFASAEKNESICFVDPHYPYEIDLYSVIKNGLYALCHIPTVKALYTRFSSKRKGVSRILRIAAFHRIYRRKFDTRMLKSATYVCHVSRAYKNDFKNDEALLEEARRLVEKYAKAKLVVTSRIHCALPCLGLETPVIYIDNAQAPVMDTCRLDGLKELFNVIQLDGERFIDQFETDTVISSSTKIVNKNGWQKYAGELADRCKQFISGKS